MHQGDLARGPAFVAMAIPGRCVDGFRMRWKMDGAWEIC
jgi:hypothetical protein